MFFSDPNPDGTSKVITLYVRPVEGQIIAHGWEVAKVAPARNNGAGVPVEYQISVARPATEEPPQKASTANKDLARRIYEEAWGRGKIAVIDGSLPTTTFGTTYAPASRLPARRA